MATQQVIAETLIEIGVDVEGANEAAKQIAGVDDEADNLEKEGGGALRAFAGVAGKAFAAIGAAATAAVAGFVAFGVATVQRAVELDTFATRVGQSVESIQVAVIAGERLGIEADNTREAIKTLNENLGELARIGTGPARDSLGSLGLQLEDLQGLEADEQIRVLGQAIQGVEDPAKQLSIAIELMGEDGAFLLPILKEDAVALDDLTNAARESGQVMSDETVSSAVQLSRQMDELTGRASGVALEIFENLLPAILDASDATLGWADENASLIAEDVTGWIDDIAIAAQQAKPLIDVMAGAFEIVLDVAKGLAVTIGVVSEQVRLLSEGEFAAAFDSDAIFRQIARAEQETLSSRAIRREQRADVAVFEEQADIAEAIARRQELRGVSAARRARGEAFDAAERRAAAGGGGGREQDVSEADEMFRGRFEAIATSLGLGSRAVDRAIEAAASQLSAGASAQVARDAGVSRLEALSGREAGTETASVTSLEDFLALSGPDQARLSTGMFRQEEVDKPVKPEAVINVTNNTFDVDIEVTGVQDPQQAAEQVVERMRDEFDLRLARAAQAVQTNVAR